MKRMILSLLCVGVMWGSTAWGTTYYVDDTATGLNDGMSWSNAFTDLQSALALASTSDEIHVAAGLYKATTGSDRGVSFLMVDGVALYGSYPDGGGDYDRRDITLHPSLLSGDIGVVSNSSDNTYRVVDLSGCSDATVLDGFVICDGQADAAGVAISGSGIYMYPGSPIIRNTIVENNYASTRGAGMLARSSSSILINVVFRNNTAGDSGGGVCNRGSSCQFINVVFDGNTVTGGNGGGLHSYGTSSAPLLLNTAFYSNSVSGNGSAIYSGDGVVVAANCIVWGNVGGAAQIANSGGIVMVTYSDVQGGYPGDHNIDMDPLFVDAPGGDFRLLHNSQLIDQGSNNVLPADVSDIDRDGDTDELIPFDMGMNLRNADCPWIPPVSDAQDRPLADIGPYEHGVVYVDASASGTGTGYSWADAHVNLTDALSAATGNGMSIWVAEGTYRPTSGTNRTVFFEVKGGLSLYGGFAGTESAVGQRDWVANRATLSGDIGTPGDVSDNSHSVVRVSQSFTSVIAGLDGFRISGGNANGSAAYRKGGGVRSERCTLHLRHLDIRENLARGGGGIWIDDCEVDLDDVVFEDNAAVSEGAGGGLQVYASSSPIVGKRLVFSGNTARIGGGLMAGGAVDLQDSRFSNNTATDSGGGAYISSGNKMSVLERVVFEENTGGLGGGLAANGDGSLRLQEVSFVRNTATNMFGGGMDCRSPSSLIDVVFHGNRATNASLGRGGGLALMYAYGTCTVVNAEFVGNIAGDDGGGMYCSDSGGNHLICDQVTVVSNQAGNGGAVYTYGQGETTIRNSILWGNGMNVSGPYDGRATITYSDVAEGHIGASNINVNPIFARNPDPGADGQWGTSDDDYGDLRLQASSLCIDGGGDPLVPSLHDLRGEDRPLDGDADGMAAPDMGAYEHYNAAGDSDGDSVTDGDEKIADTDMLDSNDWFHVSSISNDTVFFQSSDARQYTLYWSTNLISGQWSEVSSQMGAGGEDSMSGTNDVPAEFFKLEVAIP